MLVLSRRTNESIVFPNLGVSIKLLRVDRAKAKLGISAPPDIRILREEVGSAISGQLQSADEFSAHEIRNRLNTINLGMLLYQQQLKADQPEAAADTFERVLETLSEVEGRLGQTPLASVENLRLLLVEDDRRQRELLADYLRNRGCQIDTAGDTTEALSTITANGAPDFVLLDLSLPGSDGAETIARIRNCEPARNSRILAVSATNPNSIRPVMSDKELGIDRWFPKPTDPEAILEHMSRRQAVGELQR